MKRLSQKNISDLIHEIDFPPINIQNWMEEPSFPSKSGQSNFVPDYTVDIEWEGKTYKFLVEIKTQASPKQTDEAIYQLQKYLSAVDGAKNYYPLLIAPYLSEDRLDKLLKEKVSGLDLSGNGVVFIPGKIFVYRSGAKNTFPSNAPIKNVFYGTSSLIGRVFLARAEYSSVGEILEEIIERSGKTTYPTVSKVLKTLEEDLIISRNDTIRLIDGRRLLKNLAKNYRKPGIIRTVKGKSENIEKALGQLTENADKKDVLLAINDPQRYAAMPSTSASVYVEKISKVLKDVDFAEGERFSNIELIETHEQTVYFDRRRSLTENAYFTSPIQTYLELASGGKREQETAENIAEGILAFRY